MIHDMYMFCKTTNARMNELGQGGKHLNFFYFLHVEQHKQRAKPRICSTENAFFFVTFIRPFYEQCFIKTVRGPVT